MKTPAFLQDTWVRANWDHFLVLANEPALEKAKCYYNYGWMRVEMSPVGPAHAGANGLIAQIIGLYAYTHAVALISYVNPMLRKGGLQEAQPDPGVLPGRAVPATGMEQQPHRPWDDGCPGAGRGSVCHYPRR